MIDERTARRLARRHAAERRVKLYGMASVAVALAFLVALLVTIVGKGYTAFAQTEIAVEVSFDAGPVKEGDFAGLVKSALAARFPEVTARNDKRELFGLISSGADRVLRDMVQDDPGLIGRKRVVTLLASDDVDMVFKGHVTAQSGRLTARQAEWLASLRQTGAVSLGFNTTFFTAGDSREPELAGVGGAVVGSLFAMVVTLCLAFPLGVSTAVYLEEFAPKNRWTELIEVNINNLAAVPSIVFGLLGLALFLNFLNMPRSAPLVGGLVLTLMSLPVIIIASRAALKAVPPSIREAARGLGASRLQVVTHHVLPLAMPGILTGTIIATAHAIGETAPLLMIGMVAFIVDIPAGFLDPATVLPVQVYLWADSPERAFVERTSAAIMILLAFLAVMNLLAIVLRKKFERRW
ncbi:MAG: phosphate ABC transporter permease PstA [Alphaproteobacteria bacterium]|nr:phosphate ABC transporter permease PstA [Alphaproteobacteria bacterium]